MQFHFKWDQWCFFKKNQSIFQRILPFKLKKKNSRVNQEASNRAQIAVCMLKCSVCACVRTVAQDIEMSAIKTCVHTFMKTNSKLSQLKRQRKPVSANRNTRKHGWTCWGLPEVQRELRQCELPTKTTPWYGHASVLTSSAQYSRFVLHWNYVLDT